MKGRVVLGLALVALLALPLVLSPYRLLLMLPFMAYGVILLGLNLLFGYTGLVSFGHALFVGIGAYTGAFLDRPRGHPLDRGDRAGGRGPRARSSPPWWACSACAT